MSETTKKTAKPKAAKKEKLTNTELATIAPETALAVFSADNGLDPYIEKIRAEIAAFVPDTTTKKGRDEIASMAYKVAKSKTYLDNAGKDLVAELKAIPAKIDAERKRMRETLDALKDQVRQPLTDWETLEAARVEALQARVAGLENAKSLEWENADEIRETLAWVTSVVVDDSWQEYQVQGVIAKAATLDAIGKALSAREKYDAEQAELAKLRAEAAAREQADRDAAIAQQAADAERQRAEREALAERQRVEAAAQAERDAAAKREADAKADAERRELELRLQAEKAQRETLEAQQRADRAAQVERDRIAAEQAQAQAEQAAREADRDHKKKINTAALADFMAGGMTEDCAKMAITLIAKKAVRGVAITY
jgi:hypothetical protein